MKYELLRNGKYTGIYGLGKLSQDGLLKAIQHLENLNTSGLKKVIFTLRERK